METKPFEDQDLIKSIIEKRCLPEDSAEIVRDILSEGSDAEIYEELNVFAANCYRFEPNHPRYDRNRAYYPRFDEKFVA